MLLFLIPGFLNASPTRLLNVKHSNSDSVSANIINLTGANNKIDRWISADKGYHLIGSIISTTGISNSCIQFADIKKEKSIRIGAGLTFALGIGKEFWDGHQKNNIFSWKDLSADILGILIGTILLQID